MDQRDTLPREEIDPRYAWRLEDIFPGNGDWEKSFADAKKQIADLGALAGTLKLDARHLAQGLNRLYSLAHQAERLYVYARMRRDEDNAKAIYQGMADRAMSLLVEMDSAKAFVDPELLSLPEGTLESWMAAPELTDYRVYLKDLLRRRAHTLTEPEEQLLAMAGEMAMAPYHLHHAYRCGSAFSYRKG
jgi:oligoendopeptidase F